MGYALCDQRRRTYADHRTRLGEARHELIDGAALQTAAAPSVDKQ